MIAEGPPAKTHRNGRVHVLGRRNLAGRRVQVDRPGGGVPRLVGEVEAKEQGEVGAVLLEGRRHDGLERVERVHRDVDVRVRGIAYVGGARAEPDGGLVGIVTLAAATRIGGRGVSLVLGPAARFVVVRGLVGVVELAVTCRRTQPRTFQDMHPQRANPDQFHEPVLSPSRALASLKGEAGQGQGEGEGEGGDEGVAVQPRYSRRRGVPLHVVVSPTLHRTSLQAVQAAQLTFVTARRAACQRTPTVGGVSGGLEELRHCDPLAPRDAVADPALPKVVDEVPSPGLVSCAVVGHTCTQPPTPQYPTPAKQGQRDRCGSVQPRASFLAQAGGGGLAVCVMRVLGGRGLTVSAGQEAVPRGRTYGHVAIGVVEH